jgi:glutaredoxin
MRAYVIVAAALWLACTGASGQAYRWVDDQGRVHYTQTPPPPGAKKVERKNFRQSGTAPAADLPYATQVAAKNYPVTLYTMENCAPCDQARALLLGRTIPFKEVNVVTQQDIDEVKKVSGTNELPLLVVGSLFQSKFQEGLYNGLLDTAGYPASGPAVPAEKLRKTQPPAAPSTAEAGSRQGGNAQPGTDAK